MARRDRTRHGGGKAPEPWQLDGGKGLLLEVASEVCRQVGGIYTVLRSKIPSVVERWGSRYVMVGPFSPELSPLEFEAAEPAGPVGEAVAEMNARGLAVQYGHWLVSGQPRVVLMDTRSVGERLAEFQYYLWEQHEIATPSPDELLGEALGLGLMVEEFFTILCSLASCPKVVVAHFHEWTASVAVPRIRRAELPVRTVFTTHATLLGRYLAMHDPELYEHLPYVDWLGQARRMGIEPQVRLERAAASSADVFTTVSDVTARECTHLLGRDCAVTLPNGLNVERFVAVHEFQNLHFRYAEQIRTFTMAMFFPSYVFDLDRTIFFFTSGRFEYHNKGFDLTLEALARLNAMLKAERLDRTVVFLLVTRKDFHTINSEVLRRTAMLEELRRNCDVIKEELGDRLFEATARGELPDLNTLMDDYWRLRLQRLMHAWSARSLPGIVTHDLHDPDDEVLRQLRYLRLINLPSDPVKVVYHPDFITPGSPLLGMDYDHFVRGCHLGVFPSLYEPWGYTPLECVVRGVPAITSDLSGFGAHVLQHLPDHDERGIYVVRRRGISFGGAAAQLADRMLEFCRLERRDRIALRNRVEGLAGRFDWQRLRSHYDRAHLLATQAER